MATGSGTGTPASDLTHKYCTLAEIKTDIGSTSSTHDAMLEQMIEDASREIDSHCQRHFYGLVEVRYFDALRNVDENSLLLDEDLAGVISITLGDGTTLDTNDYVLLPANYSPKRTISLLASSGKWWAYQTDPENAIAVSGTWGFTDGDDPPRDVTRACINLVRWRYQQRQAPFEQAGLGDLGNYSVPSGIPQDVERMLRPYRHNRFGAITPRG